MKEFFDAEMRRLHAIREFPWQDAKAYGQFLAQTYYYVCHTTRLLGVTASRIGVDREKLHQRFLKHAAEERSHHLLAERDLTHLGTSIAAFQELPLTAALYETQYHRVEHVNPTMIFGYILALEGVSVLHGPWIYRAVREAHGDAAASFLKVHSDEDPDHLDKAFEMVNALSDPERDLIRKNLRFTCGLYEIFLRSIVTAAATSG
jgi:hypothetical protein